MKWKDPNNGIKKQGEHFDKHAPHFSNNMCGHFAKL